MWADIAYRPMALEGNSIAAKKLEKMGYLRKFTPVFRIEKIASYGKQYR
jgi:hypothetical protein